MQKGIATVWVIVVLAVAAAGGTAAYLATDGFNFSQEPTNQTTETKSSAATEAEDSPSLLRAALGGNASITCDYSIEGNNGKAYLKKDGKYSIEQTGEEGNYRLIKQGDDVYIWRTDQNQGFVFNSESFDEEMKEQFAVFSPEKFENDAETDDIDCRRSSNIEAGLFEVPADVNFVSPADQIPAN